MLLDIKNDLTLVVRQIAKNCGFEICFFCRQHALSRVILLIYTSNNWAIVYIDSP